MLLMAKRKKEKIEVTAVRIKRDFHSWILKRQKNLIKKNLISVRDPLGKVLEILTGYSKEDGKLSKL